MGPVQADLLTFSRNYLPVAHRNSQAEIVPVADGFLEYVPAEKIVLGGEPHVYATGRLIVIEGRGDKAADGTHFYGLAAVDPLGSAGESSTCRWVDLVGD